MRHIPYTDTLHVVPEVEEPALDFDPALLPGWLDRIPDIEADIISLELGLRPAHAPCTQANIAVVLGITQQGVAHRRRRAIERLRFLRWLDGTLGTADPEVVRRMVEYTGLPDQHVQSVCTVWRTSRGDRQAWQAFGAAVEPGTPLAAWYTGHRWGVLWDAQTAVTRRREEAASRSWDHLPDLDALQAKAIEVLGDGVGRTWAEMVTALGVPSATWHQVERRMRSRGLIVRQGARRRHTYSLA